MDSRNKKKIFGIANKMKIFGIANKKKSRCKNKKRASLYKKRRRSELKDMKKLRSDDEAFHLSLMTIKEILDIIRSRKTPARKTYMQWDEYAISFYLKMCICCGVDYQHLEATPKYNDDDDYYDFYDDDDADFDDDDGKKPLKEEEEEHMECSGGNQPSTKEMSYEELVKQGRGSEEMMIFRRMSLRGPYKFGSYSSGTTPDRIPYHLYLLVKEAADIKNNTNDLTDLTLVEEKIRFFCNYFHCHLPPGWNYHRNNASFLIAGYDTMRKPRYLMAGYSPTRMDKTTVDYDEGTLLSPYWMAKVMNIIHSRKTKTPPSFGKMIRRPQLISFYCKLCSCFGIDYYCFEAASEDDVCLMNVGGSPSY